MDNGFVKFDMTPKEVAFYDLLTEISAKLDTVINRLEKIGAVSPS